MKLEHETMTLNGVDYVKKDLIKPTKEVIMFTGEETVETVATVMIGKKVIVRSSNEGINAGIVELADETGVVLKECRRLYYHRPVNDKVSWYEGVAQYGISDTSKVSCTCDRKVIIEKYSLTECTEDAYKSIMELSPHEQS